MKKLIKKANNQYAKAGAVAGMFIAGSATNPAMAAFTPPAEATTAVTDVGDAITWAVGIGFTLASVAVVGSIGIGLFKKFSKKGAS